MNPDRRRVLTLSAAAAAGAFFGSGRVFASMEDVEKAIADFSNGQTPGEGVLSLTTPEIAENGNSVPVSVSVDSPMTEDDHVEAVMLLAEGNPSPDVATFNFTPASGEAVASTRMRLAKTQNITALARLSSGEVYKVSNNVKVTIGGCGG